MKHLFQVSLGPVQGFIAASRKTRDLKAGSDLLVNMTRAAVDAIGEKGVQLIFPADPKDRAANIILAVIEEDPQSLARRVEEKVRGFMSEQWDQAVKDAGCLSASDIDRGRQQAEQFPEVYIAWAPMNGSYLEARKACGKAMAARKALRDFQQPNSSSGLPKSPLAPWLDTVVPVGEGFRVKGNLGQRLGHLKDRETLDAVSLIKRLTKLGPSGSFPSTRTIAAAGFLSRLDAGLVQDVEKALSDLNADCDIGDLVFNDIEESARDQIEDLQRQLVAGAKAKGVDRPRPYFAVLRADGDSMGKFLDQVGNDLEKHRSFSSILSKEFAEKVEETVAKWSGQCVYAGGDDVLALLPMETAIECAEEVHRLFDDAMQKLSDTEANAAVPTLSVGLAFVHCLENLQEAVSFSADLEHRAKKVDGKNAIAIGARARSGGDAVVVMPWPRGPEGAGGGAKKHFASLMQAMEANEIPRGFPYEIRKLVGEMGLLGKGEGRLSEEQLLEWAKGEIDRIAKRKEPTVQPEIYDWIDSLDDVKAFSDMLLVSHFLTREAD